MRAQSLKAAQREREQREADALARREASNRKIAGYRMEDRTPALVSVRSLAGFVTDREYAETFKPQPKGIPLPRKSESREKRPMNAAEKRWVDACCRLGCVVCRHFLLLDTAGVPCIWHHIRNHEVAGAAMRAPHTCGLALCVAHHDSAGEPGVAYHAAPEQFERNFGSQYLLMALQVEDVAAANKGLR